MSKMQRDKGANFERWLVNYLKTLDIKAKRNLDQWRDKNLADVTTDVGVLVECKIAARGFSPLYDALAQNNADVACVRQDGERALMVVEMDHYWRMQKAVFDGFCPLCRRRSLPAACWLCAAASRIAAGEPEADVLADYGYARPTNGEGVK